MPAVYALNVYCRRGATSWVTKHRIVVKFRDEDHFEEEAETAFSGIDADLLKLINRRELTPGTKYYICDDTEVDEEGEEGECVDLDLTRIFGHFFLKSAF